VREWLSVQSHDHHLIDHGRPCKTNSMTMQFELCLQLLTHHSDTRHGPRALVPQWNHTWICKGRFMPDKHPTGHVCVSFLASLSVSLKTSVLPSTEEHAPCSHLSATLHPESQVWERRAECGPVDQLLRWLPRVLPVLLTSPQMSGFQ
jgi:hypothetical protein